MIDDPAVVFYRENASVAPLALEQLPPTLSAAAFLLLISVVIALRESSERLPAGVPPLAGLEAIRDAGSTDELRKALGRSMDTMASSWGLENHISTYTTLANNLLDSELSLLVATVEKFVLPNEHGLRQRVVNEVLFDLLLTAQVGPKRRNALLGASRLLRRFSRAVKPQYKRLREVRWTTASVLPGFLHAQPLSHALEIVLEEATDLLSLLQERLFLQLASPAGTTVVHTESFERSHEGRDSPSPLAADLTVAVAPSKPASSADAGHTDLGFLEPLMDATAPSGVAIALLPAAFLHRAADEPVRAALLEQDLLLAAGLVPHRKLPLYASNAALLVLTRQKPVRLQQHFVLLDKTRNRSLDGFSTDDQRLHQIVNGDVLTLKDSEGAVWGQTITLSDAQQSNFSLSLASYTPSAFEPSTSVNQEVNALRARSAQIRRLLGMAEEQLEGLLSSADLRGEQDED